MWELVEGMFYYLKSKNKRLPTFLSLTIIGMTLLFYFSVPSTPPAPIAPIEIQVGPEKEIPHLPRQKVQAPKTLVKPTEVKPPVKKEEQSYFPEIKTETLPEPSNHQEVVSMIEHHFRTEGVDPSIGIKIYQEMRRDLVTTQRDTYDIAEAVRSALGPDASEEEVDRIKALTLKSIGDSWNMYTSRNNLNDQ